MALGLLDQASLRALLFYSLLIRCSLVVYSEWQDANMVVKYTDVDYLVFSDASRFMVEGGSPYLRTTYRYTPLLSFLLIPNVWFFSFGKILFCLADILIGYLLFEILKKRGISEQKSKLYACFWLFNPLSINVSTRGNAESLVSFLVVLTLYFIMKKKVFLAALFYGLSVHLKIYPILYALPFILFLDPVHFRGATIAGNAVTRFLKRFLSRDQIVFAVVSALVFCLLTGLFYYLYGFEFLYETYLYHLVRKDNRHNLSIYFYHLYLTFAAPSSFLTALLSFLPQLLLTISLAVYFSSDIAFCIFLQTFCFVVLNKVCTVQYFIWYLAVLPLLLPSSTLNLKRALALTALFFSSLGLWMWFGYQLEFLGTNTFFSLWLAGVLFFVVNMYILAEIIRHHTLTPVFVNGSPVPLCSDKDTRTQQKTEKRKKGKRLKAE
eukprot:GCRY01005015.1.p1 GENE.GCRY01005015.1~~GCRY01005015.1.p1  ORF type:complete len:436 (-),score=79.91 GCRY01005015.1:90-1397(-)